MSHPFTITKRFDNGARFTWKINLNAINNQIGQGRPRTNWHISDQLQPIKITTDAFSITGHLESAQCELILKVLEYSSADRYEEMRHYSHPYVDFKIGLKCLKLDILKRKLNFSTAIHNQSGETYYDFKITHLFTTSTTEVFSKRLAFPENSCAILNGHVFSFNQSQMVISGEIRIIEDESLLNKSEHLNVSHLQRDLKMALLDKQFADVAFKVKNDTLHAHKIILAYRSPVFQKMFEHDMKENSSNSIEIIDVEKPILEIFLSFLYTGILEERKLDNLMPLYSIADKYEVESLQTTCRGLLITHLSVKTAPTILKLAHLHNDSNLKKIVIEFISNHFVQVESTDPWKLVLDTDPHLASETLRYVSTHILKK